MKPHVRQHRGIFITVGLSLLIGLCVTPSRSAFSQEQGRDRHEQARPPQHREVRREALRRREPERRPDYGYDVPAYVPNPPPVVYSPPPPPPGISLFFNFR